MHAPITSIEGAPIRRAARTLLTERLRVVLERRSVRLAVVGAMLAAGAAMSFVPRPLETDAGWIFVVPVALSAVAAGLSEGLLASLLAAVISAMVLAVQGAEAPVIAGVAASRFALYGITAAFLGAFAEAHYSVQSSLRRLAALDPLTQVDNVATFYAHLDGVRAAGGRFAVMLVDIDCLKDINDRYGHPVGSAVIRSVANALKMVVRGTDCVARYGGDEFAVILRDADRAGAQIVVNRLREMLAEVRLPGAPLLRPSVSAGVALSDEQGGAPEVLLAAADEEMYVDKRSRKAHG